MICPECENGKVFRPMAHVRASKDFGKFNRCLRCNGSGALGRPDGKDVTYQTGSVVHEEATST
jgi:hypothetical protein